MLVGNPADWLVQASDPRVITQSRASAWLKIAEGCDRTCAFCVIPHLRGKQRSRTADDVVAEAEQLVAAGAVEINLVSQDTVAYGRDLARASRKAGGPPAGAGGAALAELVRRVADVKGVRWVRIFYLYPETLDDALVELLAQHPRVVPYVDMPLQHASDAMLKRMRRGHGKDRQRRVVERLRDKVPGLTFRTAFIVGHPGETAADFDELCDFVTWARFEHAVVFRYSDEETCTAHGFDGKVPALVAANRARKLLALQRGIAREKNGALVGRELEVLVEGPSEDHELVMKGRHAGQAPEIDGSVYLSEGEAHAGEMRTVRIVQASDWDLVGELQGESAAAPPAKPRVSLKVLGSSARDRAGAETAARRGTGTHLDRVDGRVAAQVAGLLADRQDVSAAREDARLPGAARAREGHHARLVGHHHLERLVDDDDVGAGLRAPAARGELDVLRVDPGGLRRRLRRGQRQRRTRARHATKDPEARGERADGAGDRGQTPEHRANVVARSRPPRVNHESPRKAPRHGVHRQLGCRSMSTL